MPSTGPQLVTLASGTGWTAPGNITGSGSGYATETIGSGGVSGPLIGTKAPLSVPVGATINGIVVSATAVAEASFELFFFNIALRLGGGTIGVPKSDTVTWKTVPRSFSYGSPTDLWGATLTQANVVDPTFGFQTAVENGSSESDLASVGSYSINVYYTFGGGGGGIPGPSNGGMLSPLNMLLIPAQVSFNSFSFLTLDPTNFNDPNSGSVYNWKVEDGIAGRTLTVNRVILSYRDLGVAQIMLSLSGVTGPTDPLQPNTPVSSVSPLVTIGTPNATGKICTLIYGLSLSAANQQLSVIRAANGGPVSITKARLEGKVETTTY